MNYEQGISIDGQYFDVPLVGMKRNFDFLDKYAQRTEDGDLKRSLIGVYANYTLTFGTMNDVDLYERLVDKLTEPVEFHDFALPTSKGTYSFRGYIASVQDQIVKIKKEKANFTGLSCKFISKKPFRTPTKA